MLSAGVARETSEEGVNRAGKSCVYWHVALRKKKNSMREKFRTLVLS